MGILVGSFDIGRCITGTHESFLAFIVVHFVFSEAKETLAFRCHCAFINIYYMKSDKSIELISKYSNDFPLTLLVIRSLVVSNLIIFRNNYHLYTTFWSNGDN